MLPLLQIMSPTSDVEKVIILKDQTKSLREFAGSLDTTALREFSSSSFISQGVLLVVQEYVIRLRKVS